MDSLETLHQVVLIHRTWVSDGRMGVWEAVSLLQGTCLHSGRSCRSLVNSNNPHDLPSGDYEATEPSSRAVLEGMTLETSPSDFSGGG